MRTLHHHPCAKIGNITEKTPGNPLKIISQNLSEDRERNPRVIAFSSYIRRIPLNASLVQEESTLG